MFIVAAIMIVIKTNNHHAKHQHHQDTQTHISPSISRNKQTN